MSIRTPRGDQADTISRYSPFVQQSFDLDKQDAFVTSLAVDFAHYKAMPSPLGKKDRGDYRRSDGVDTITANGFIYRCAGKFSATMVDNDRNQKRTSGGISDPSKSRLILPRFYNKDDVSDGSRIYLAPGDRLYIADPNADDRVETYEEVDYQEGIDNTTLFPICCLVLPIVDSNNIEYKEHLDFEITKEGWIRWLSTGRNPGIDPLTGKGRVYTVRYRYKAFWYVTELPKEIRITNVTNGELRGPQRMPYHAIIVREFMYHNQNKGDKMNQLVPKDKGRQNIEPVQSITPDKYPISVDMSNITDEETQS